MAVESKQNLTASAARIPYIKLNILYFPALVFTKTKKELYLQINIIKVSSSFNKCRELPLSFCYHSF